MGRIWRADKLYFDELGMGLSAGVFFDDSNGDKNFDSEGNVQVTAVVSVSLLKEEYYEREVLDLNITSVFTEKENYAKYVDLMELVPLKFRDSVVLQELLNECGILVGTWVGNINDMEKLLDKYNVGTDYMQYLADLLGYQIVRADTVTVSEKRRQLIQVIDWYKEKGTYVSIKHIAYVLGFSLNVWDTYTADYSTFVREEWFVGYEDEDPAGLDPATYYKSPHMVAEIVLDKAYGDSLTNDYLFVSTMMEDLTEYIELVRPINTVVHYSMFLNPVTTESGAVYTGPGYVAACVNVDWEFSRKYFDMSWDSLHFDSDPTTFFDYTFDSFLNNITVYQVGVGHVNTLPDESDTALESSVPVLTGAITNHVVYADRVEFNFIVPSDVVQAGITELGLFLADGTTMVAEATFPSIEKVEGIELRVAFAIYI